MKNFYFGRVSQARLDGVHPVLQHIMEEAIESSPIDFGIPEYGGKREVEDQALLYAKGKSKCDGYIKKSPHQEGLAVDIYAYVNGKASWDKRLLCALAGHILGTAKRLNYELRWGGDWDADWDMDEHNFIDMPHFELVL